MSEDSTAADLALIAPVNPPSQAAERQLNAIEKLTNIVGNAIISEEYKAKRKKQIEEKTLPAAYDYLYFNLPEFINGEPAPWVVVAREWSDVIRAAEAILPVADQPMLAEYRPKHTALVDALLKIAPQVTDDKAVATNDSPFYANVIQPIYDNYLNLYYTKIRDLFGNQLHKASDSTLESRRVTVDNASNTLEIGVNTARRLVGDIKNKQANKPLDDTEFETTDLQEREYLRHVCDRMRTLVRGKNPHENAFLFQHTNKLVQVTDPEGGEKGIFERIADDGAPLTKEERDKADEAIKFLEAMEYAKILYFANTSGPLSIEIAKRELQQLKGGRSEAPNKSADGNMQTYIQKDPYDPRWVALNHYIQAQRSGNSDLVTANNEALLLYFTDLEKYNDALHPENALKTVREKRAAADAKLRPLEFRKNNPSGTIDYLRAWSGTIQPKLEIGALDRQIKRLTKALPEVALKDATEKRIAGGMTLNTREKDGLDREIVRLKEAAQAAPEARLKKAKEVVESTPYYVLRESLQFDYVAFGDGADTKKDVFFSDTDLKNKNAHAVGFIKSLVLLDNHKEFIRQTSSGDILLDGNEIDNMTGFGSTLKPGESRSPVLVNATANFYSATNAAINTIASGAAYEKGGAYDPRNSFVKKSKYHLVRWGGRLTTAAVSIGPAAGALAAHFYTHSFTLIPSLVMAGAAVTQTIWVHTARNPAVTIPGEKFREKGLGTKIWGEWVKLHRLFRSPRIGDDGRISPQPAGSKTSSGLLGKLFAGLGFGVGVPLGRFLVGTAIFAGIGYGLGAWAFGAAALPLPIIGVSMVGLSAATFAAAHFTSRIPVLKTLTSMAAALVALTDVGKGIADRSPPVHEFATKTTAVVKSGYGLVQKLTGFGRSASSTKHPAGTTFGASPSGSTSAPSGTTFGGSSPQTQSHHRKSDFDAPAQQQASPTPSATPHKKVKVVSNQPMWLDRVENPSKFVYNEKDSRVELGTSTKRLNQEEANQQNLTFQKS